MGIISQKDVFSSKFITAEIEDSANRIFFVPIKYILGDRFLATIEGQIYCFKLDGSRIKTYRHTLTKSCRILHYTTDHTMPISPGKTKELENLLRDNNLPKVNGKILDIFKILAKKEKVLKPGEPFPPHDLEMMVEMVAMHEEDYPEKAINLKNFLESLDAKQIATPVRPISEFLEEDLKTTDPLFLGEIYSQLKRTEIEQKKMANVPASAKGPWLKILLIVMIVGMIAGVGIWAYTSGIFNHILPTIGGPSLGTPTTTQGIIAKYPTPEALKKAIDSGEIKYSDLPDEAKKMVDNYKPPTATPVIPPSSTPPPKPITKPTSTQTLKPPTEIQPATPKLIDKDPLSFIPSFSTNNATK